MSDAVPRITPNRLVRGLAGAAAALGLAGGALSLALAGGPLAGAPAAHHATAVASAPVTASADTAKPKDPFACAAVFGWGICIGPPTSS